MGKPTKEYSRWRIRWWDAGGKRRSETHATYKAAEKALFLHQAEADEIKHGIRLGPPPDKAFRDLADYWLEHRASRKKNPKDDRSIINTSLHPFFGDLKLTLLTLERVDAYRKLKCPGENDSSLSPQQRRMRGSITVKTLHNHLTLLISMLNLALELGWLRSKPRIRKPKLGKIDFSYIRSKDDIQKFLAAAQEEEKGTFELYAAAIYTGMRCGELLGLHWSDVDFDKRLITVQRSYDSATKTEHVRHVPILDVLLPILRKWKLRCPSPTLVFPNKVGRMHTASPRVTQEILQQTRTRAGIEHRFTFHSLRHTFASWWAMSGGNLFKLQRILGHRTFEMTLRYSHLAPEAFVADYGIFGTSLPVAENQDKDNVAGFPPTSS